MGSNFTLRDIGCKMREESGEYSVARDRAGNQPLSHSASIRFHVSVPWPRGPGASFWRKAARIRRGELSVSGSLT